MAENNFHSAPTEFIVAAAKNPHIISGPLIEIDRVNLNKWGIPSNEVETLKAGLLGVPLKICGGKDAIFDQHSCDYNWDPKANIGKIIAAHKENGWIHATAIVTDPVAQSKLDSHTWDKKWSIFGGYKYEDIDNMRYGTIPKSVTLVTDPAYPNAGFKRQAASSNSSHQEIDNMAGEDDPKPITQEEVDKQIADAVEAEQATQVEAQEALNVEHQEAFAASEKKHEENLAAKDAEISKLQSAGKENGDKLEDMVPRVEVEKLVSAATEQATTNTMELLKKTALSDEILTMQASFNIVQEGETEDARTELMKKSSAALEHDKVMLERMGEALEKHSSAAVDKFKEANLPTKGNPAGLALSWDIKTQEWS